MLKVLKIACLLFMCAMVGFVMKTVSRSHQKEIYMSDSSDMPVHPPNGININLTNILSGGNGILFLETTDRMEPPSLVLCAIESAARVYHDRPILYFMKGLHDIETDEDMNRTRNLFPALSSFDNVHILPLRFEELFNNTPLQSWYEKVNPAKEIYWTHVKSDACRFAMMWKYGGIYMDTDVISIKPIPEDHFLAAQSFIETSSSVFGLSPHHKLTWEFMENFVQNYRGGIWGHQGPGVFSRVVAKYCGVPQFKSVDHVDCANVSYFHPERFYPIPYQSWRDYFKVWKDLRTFNNSYALHLWNYMNNEGKFMTIGSNTLVEHLYQQFCPSTYGAV
ncbi:alpha-1,4-N-acetylglucosaminyltransferase-like [Bufo bufo]|uniref:alpha-1,4-N-acetylglucosaminyltransferase-like n=1 Tax=Bufo bufo TaxID=8384 RepID=UPI001ABDED9D|nr:alpha-1,4-N-acetylglucosaminyltransferase-like [Bufo bufo]